MDQHTSGLHFLREAIKEAEDAERAGNLPVGAVIVLDGEIVARGKSGIWKPHTALTRHAEMEALRAAPAQVWDRSREVTLYTTLEPCLMCAGAILLHRIGRLVYGSADPYGGIGASLGSLPPYFREQLARVRWEGPALPAECDPLFERLTALEGIHSPDATFGASVCLRWMNEDELPRIGEIDRAESVRLGYEMAEGRLTAKTVEWNVPTFFPEGDGAHTVASLMRFCRGHLDRGAVMIGAIADDALVGIGVMTPEVRPGVAQLALLHVSAGYRRLGIASRMAQALVEWACEAGARQVYVSAMPSESAVGFYLSQGFAPAAAPLPELYELEPEDIHMLKDLACAG